MSILTDKTTFTGTPADNDLIHMVRVSDPTDNPAGTSFSVAFSTLSTLFNPPTSLLWQAGSGTNSMVQVGSSGNASQVQSISASNAASNAGDYSAIIGGYGHTISDGSDISAIIGGTNNEITGGGDGSVMFGGSSSTIYKSSTSAIIGGSNHMISGSTPTPTNLSAMLVNTIL